MRRYLLYLLLLISISMQGTPVSNVRVYQDGMKIVLLYDLKASAYINRVIMETEDGATKIVPNKYLSGDVNREVTAGENKRIVYDVLADQRNGLRGSVQFSIESVHSKDVVVTADNSSEHIYAKSAYEDRYVYKGKGTWYATNIDYGEYHIKRTRDKWMDQYDTIYVTHSTSNIYLKPMKPKQGNVSVTSFPSNASVYVDGSYVGLTPWRGQLGVGSHTIYTSKTGRVQSESERIYVQQNGDLKTHFHLKNIRVLLEDEHPDHYVEPMYAFDVWGTHDHYAGLRYAWIPRHFGLDVSALYGIGTSEVSATVGPSFRLTRLTSPLSLQLTMGGGIMYRMQDNYYTWAADAALRFGFREGGKDLKYGWWSFSLGARYYDKRIIPTASISLMPVRALTLAAIAEEDFPCIYIDTQAGYQFENDEYLFGGQFSYIPSHLGIGSSFFVGLDGGWDVTAGPVFRFTPDYIPFDLQLYQGFGYGQYGCDSSPRYPSGQYNGFLAETSLRFAFGYNKPYFGLWSFSIGCVYGPETTIVTCGVSLPIVGVASLLGAAAVGLMFL